MPTYEYHCHKCGEFEVTQRITEASLKKCPTCKGKVERLVSRSSFILKGSGWYATDYGRKTPPPAGESSSANGTTTNGSSESKPESKPESKSESKASTEKPSPTKSAS
jgi:putative FmdB family regulatory protein